jgi:TolB-like protein
MAILAGSPPLNGAVVLPGNIVVDARALAVLPLVVASDVAPVDSARAAAFAAALDGELVGALRAVPGFFVVNAAPVPKGAAAALPPSAIGALVGARGIVAGTVLSAESGIEVELVLLDATNDTRLWRERYRAGAAAAPIAARAIEHIAAALVAPPSGESPALRARGTSALASFGTQTEEADE